jgi:hypothetical protein
VPPIMRDRAVASRYADALPRVDATRTTQSAHAARGAQAALAPERLLTVLRFAALANESGDYLAAVAAIVVAACLISAATGPGRET